MNPHLSRREMLSRCSTGFGLTAWSALWRPTDARAQRPAPHFPPRARHVIFCYMSGGVSHLDSFDDKPLLRKLAGQPMPVPIQRTMFNDNGSIFPTPFRFAQHGESGLSISSMFPWLARHCADKIAVIRSMTSKSNEHAQGNYFFHTGFPFLGHPSAGAWIHYGLGSENQDLPGFVVLRSGTAVAPHGGVGLFGNGFLPAQHQASIVVADARPPIPNLTPRERPSSQRARLDYLAEADAEFASASGQDPQVEAAIRNYETAARMQSAVPELVDLSGESAETRALYGVDDPLPQKAAYAKQCLLARRLVERGVRFVELSCLTHDIGSGGAPNPWDQHGDLERGHAAMAQQVDQPIAALLMDLERRGLLDETLVIWAGEFGRTPFSQGSNGRDHNPGAFSIWLAGGGARGGTVYGTTDELGYHVVDKPVTVYDLWATVQHLLGLDHERLTFLSGGRHHRLTDVFGNVIHDVIA
jgi:hypothetical protein